MKNTLLLLFGLIFLACSQNSNQAPEVAADAKVNQRPEPQKQPATIKPDTTPPVRNRPNYVMDTARPKSEIDPVYPHDIPLQTADGQQLTSAQVLQPNGKPTVLLFWLTTCAPCALEMKTISQQYPAWEKEADFNFVAISTDFSKNYPNFVKRVQQKKWPWDTYHDIHREFRRVMPGGLNGLPQTFIIDKDGTIAYHKRKYRPGDEKALFAKVKELASK